MQKKSKTLKLPDIKAKIKSLLTHIEKSEWNKADEVATKLLLSYPNNTDVLIPASKVKFMLYDESEALKLIDRSIKASSSPEHFIAIAIEHLQARNFQVSESIANSIIKKYHTNQISFEILGISLKHQGRYQDAIKHFENAIKINKKAITAWMNMGNTYISMNKYSEALKCFSEALSIEPSNLEALRLLGVCHIGCGENDKAIAKLNKALSFSPNSISILHDLAAAFYNIKDYTRAMEAAKKALSLEPHNLSLSRLFSAISNKIAPSFVH